MIVRRRSCCSARDLGARRRRPRSAPGVAAVGGKLGFGPPILHARSRPSPSVDADRVDRHVPHGQIAGLGVDEQRRCQSIVRSKLVLPTPVGPTINILAPRFSARRSSAPMIFMMVSFRAFRGAARIRADGAQLNFKLAEVRLLGRLAIGGDGDGFQIQFRARSG